MNKKAERNWLISILLFFCLITGIIVLSNSNGTLDVNLHDTYFILDKMLVILFIGFSLVFFHLLLLLIKRLALINIPFKIVSISLTLLLSFTLFALNILAIMLLKTSHAISNDISIYSFLLLLFGSAMMCVIRAVEIIKIRHDQ